MQIIVLGMHRSGTSALTRLTNMMGAYIGDESSSIGANEENPKGFWERKDVTVLNEAILKAAGGSWHDTARIDMARMDEARREKLTHELRQVLMRLEPFRPWVTKDPRLCLTLGFWREHLELPLCLMTWRSPLQVAQSLAARNGFSIRLGIALWEQYTLEALRSSMGLPRMVIAHGDLMREPVATAQKIYDFLVEHGAQRLAMPSEREIAAFIDPKLYRAQGTDQEQEGFVTVPVARLDAALRDGSALEWTSVPELSAGSREALEEHAAEELKRRMKAEDEQKAQRVGAEFEAYRIASEQKIHHLEERLAMESSRLQEQLEKARENTDGRRVTELERRNAALEEARTQLESRNRELEQHVEPLNDELAELRESLNELQSLIKGREDLLKDLQEETAQAARREEELKRRAMREKLERQLLQRRTRFDEWKAILDRNAYEIERLGLWIEQLNRDLQEILDSRRWKVGHLLINDVAKRALLMQRDHVYWAPQHAEEIVARFRVWKSRTAGKYSTAIMSLPSPGTLFSAEDLRAGERSIEEIDEVLVRLYEVAQKSHGDLEQLARWTEAIYLDIEWILHSRRWKTGDLLINGIVKRLMRSRTRNQNWAPHDAKEIMERCKEVRAAAMARRTFLQAASLPFGEGVKALLKRPAESEIVDPGKPPLKLNGAGHNGFVPAEISEEAAVEGRLERGLNAIRRVPAGEFRGSVTVIVPIYNAYEELKQCLESILTHTNEPHRILLLDDCSTDERIWPLISQYDQEHAHITAVRHESNLGYTRNINFGLSMADGDIVLLNSDTQVTPRWLAKLNETAYSRPNVATVTPLTNSGSAFSVPENNAVNELPPTISIETMAALVESLSKRVRPEAPTGNGFCLYITRQALDAVGRFDEENFARGYGEENDFCLRAIECGMVNLIDDSTFIFHAEGASFLETKRDILTAALKKVEEKHPGYHSKIQQWLAVDELAELRAALREVFNEQQSRPAFDIRPGAETPTILFVEHNGWGGTILHVDDLARSLYPDYQCLILKTERDRWHLSAFTGLGFEDLQKFSFTRPWKLIDDHSGERRNTLDRICSDYQVGLVHIHHLLGVAPEMVQALKVRGIPVVMSFHDYFSVCPVFNLLDEHHQYCGGHCTPGKGPCEADIDWLVTPPLKHEYVNTWQKRIEQALAEVDACVTFSGAARDIVTEHYGKLAREKLRIIPHGQDLEDFFDAAATPERKPARVVLLGALGASKGTALIENVLKLNQENGSPFEFHFLGKLHPNFKPQKFGGVLHWEYERDELPNKLAEIRPSFSMIASIWPETFCYTLSESWAAGIPVMASNMGALAERIKDEGGGWLLDHRNPRAWFERMLEIASSKDEYEQRRREIDKIRLRSIGEMSEEYRTLYGKLIPAAAEERILT